MILFGQIEGLQLNVEDALYGSEYVEVIRDPKIGRAMPKQRRYQTGAFFPGEAGEPFRDLAAVLWMEIQGADAKERNYRLYVNNNAREKLPAVVKAALNEVLHENSLRPCDDSDDDLTPEARRLLGLE